MRHLVQSRRLLDDLGPERRTVLVPVPGLDPVAVEVEDREPEQRPPLPARVEVPGRLPRPGRRWLVGVGVRLQDRYPAVADTARELDPLGGFEAHAAVLVAPPPG